MLAVLAAQIGCAPDAFADYAARDTTLREHRVAIERRLGLRAFVRTDRTMAFATASEVATSTDRCDAIVAAMVERLRGASVVLPVPALLERIALVARAERLIDQARLFRDTARLHIRLGRTLLDARGTGRNALARIDERIGWPVLEQSLRAAEELTRPGEDGLDEVVERYAAVRRFLPTFLAAFRFRTARAGDPLLGAVELLRTFYADGRTILPPKAPVSFLKSKWRRTVLPSDGAFIPEPRRCIHRDLAACPCHAALARPNTPGPGRARPYRRFSEQRAPVLPGCRRRPALRKPAPF